jgi:hypothetical protein
MRLVITTDTGRQSYENVRAFFSDNETICVVTKDVTRVDVSRIITVIVEYPPLRKKVDLEQPNK